MGRDFRRKKISEKVDFLPSRKPRERTFSRRIGLCLVTKTGPGRIATGAQILSEIGFSEILGCFSR